MTSCLACDLINGAIDLPGGRIHETKYWVVEHCVGELPLGTLILKPFRHVTHVYELNEAESAELGPLLTRLTSVVQEVTEADQVYVCLWSHAGWQPGHIHFVLQPSWNRLRDEYPNPGPFVQVRMFEDGAVPSPEDIEAIAATISTRLN